MFLLIKRKVLPPLGSLAAIRSSPLPAPPFRQYPYRDGDRRVFWALACLTRLEKITKLDVRFEGNGAPGASHGALSVNHIFSNGFFEDSRRKKVNCLDIIGQKQSRYL